MRVRRVLLFSAVLVATTGTTLNLAQTLPTSQPGLIEIVMEDVKIGHADDHETNEANWVTAFTKAKFPYSSLALVSMTGVGRVWFTTAYDSHATIGNSVRLMTESKELAADMSRLSRIDAEHIEGFRIVQARARPDLSHGGFPDIATQRFWEVTTFRVRPGFEDEFAAAAKAYAASAARNAPKTNYRTYEVIAGLPGPTFLVFGSVAAFADFDAAMSGGDTVMKGLNATEQQAMEKLGQGLINSETHRFTLSPRMSYVPADVRAKDPKFWSATPD